MQTLQATHCHELIYPIVQLCFRVTAQNGCKGHRLSSLKTSERKLDS